MGLRDIRKWLEDAEERDRLRKENQLILAIENWRKTTSTIIDIETMSTFIVAYDHKEEEEQWEAEKQMQQDHDNRNMED